MQVSGSYARLFLMKRLLHQNITDSHAQGGLSPPFTQFGGVSPLKGTGVAPVTVLIVALSLT